MSSSSIQSSLKREIADETDNLEEKFECNNCEWTIDQWMKLLDEVENQIDENDVMPLDRRISLLNWNTIGEKMKQPDEDCKQQYQLLLQVLDVCERNLMNEETCHEPADVIQYTKDDVPKHVNCGGKFIRNPPSERKDPTNETTSSESEKLSDEKTENLKDVDWNQVDSCEINIDGLKNLNVEFDEPLDLTNKKSNEFKNKESKKHEAEELDVVSITSDEENPENRSGCSTKPFENPLSGGYNSKQEMYHTNFEGESIQNQRKIGANKRKNEDLVNETEIEKLIAEFMKFVKLEPDERLELELIDKTTLSKSENRRNISVPFKKSDRPNSERNINQLEVESISYVKETTNPHAQAEREVY